MGTSAVAGCHVVAGRILVRWLWWRCVPALRTVLAASASSSPSRRHWARNFGSVQDISVPDCPWLIVQGDADEVVDASVVKQWASQLQPPPRLVTLPGVGHFFHGQLAALQQQVVPFLQAP